MKINISTVGDLCCGCSNCENICPKNCIKMTVDSEGFLIPKVDEKICVECGVCIKKCPALEENSTEITEPQVYAVHNKNSETIMKSSSGGVFSLVAEEIIKMGGTVYGAVLDGKNDEVIFTSAKEKSEILPMQGSKYVQSILYDTFRKIEADLKESKPVLFSGTPCQCAAAKAYFGENDDLYTTDIICHGVPSPGLYKKYMNWLSQKEKSQIKNYRFRTKEHGWGMKLSYTVGDKTKYKTSIFDPYNSNFLNCNTYRECCYKCKYATKKRYGDITLGDYWGVLSEHPDFYHKDGVSLVLVNSEKGKQLFDRFKEKNDYVESTFDKAAKHNENLKNPSKRPPVRNSIYDGFKTNDYYIKDKLRVKNPAKKIIKTLIPNDFKMILKKFMR